MISLEQAQDLVRIHLGDSARAAHSLFVGFAMRRLARQVSADAVLWELVGLCHDLDYFETRQNPAKHGLVAAAWLAEMLPREALIAIEAHDHRTGVLSSTPLADALKLADTLALICEAMGNRAAAVLDGPEAEHILAVEFAERAYLPRLLLEASGRLGLGLGVLAEISRTAPIRF